MYRLYLVLKNRAEPPSEDEVLIASGKKALDPAQAADYLTKLEAASKTIIDSFNQQTQKAAVGVRHPCSSSYLPHPIQEDWDQALFEKLLTEWMVVCDQPFEEVDRPEFRHLLEYTHFRPSLKIPHCAAMRSRIMKMGEDTIQGTKKMISVRIS